MAKRRRNYSLPHILNERETRGDLVARQLEREKHVTIELVERLGLFKELVGHEGCVNCLDWNKSGTILASGSDDQSVILWNGFTGTLKTQLNTEHQGNIFSVKFLPETGDSLIVTGGQDARVCLLDVEKKVCVRSAALHIGRVKRLAVSPDTSGIFWSSAEDGTVMQWDTREKWREGGNNVLINLVKHVGKAEIKSIAVNPTKPELIAIGANDPYVRVYDRRKLSLQKLTEESGETVRNWERRTQLAVSGGAGDSTPHDAVQYFTPKHLPDQEAKYKSTLRTLTSTYLSYSSAGTELLVNTGGEHVYLYQKFRLFEKNPPPSIFKQLSVIQGCAETTSQPSAESVLPKDVETLKLAANSEFESGNHYRAIELYNLAISRCASHVLYANRAAALLKRAFRGDVYAALRDCLSALKLNPGYVKAHLRLGRCLTELEWLEEAELCLSNFKSNFPEHIKSKAFKQLLNDFQSAQDKKVAKDKEAKNSSVPDQEEEREASVPYTREDFLRSVDGERDGEEEEMEVDEERFIPPRLKISSQEIKWRRLARDYSSRFVGAANIQTDIKEASFFGSDCQFVVAGSDDGRILIWDTRTSNLVKVLAGDNITVNCVQGHPGAPVLASSGIETIIRLWHPLPENSTKESRNIQEMEKVVRENQNRMTQDPFEFFMRTADIRGEDEMQCRTS